MHSPFEAKAQKQEKEHETTSKVVDSTRRAEMTMPMSLIMGDSTERKSPPQFENKSLVSTIAKEIKQENKREKEKPFFVERTIVQQEADFDKKCEEASKAEKESTKWPPSMVYGITPQTSSTEEGSRQ